MWGSATARITHPCALILIVAAPFCATSLQAQMCTVSPRQVKLGDTLRISCPAEFTFAKLNDRSSKLYLQPNGQRFGLLPISVKDSPGSYPLVLSRSDGGEPKI